MVNPRDIARERRGRRRRRRRRIYQTAVVWKLRHLFGFFLFPQNQYRKITFLGKSTAAFGLLVKASASRAESPGFDSRLRRDFSGSSNTSDLKKMTLLWLSCQTPCVIGSALGLIGLVSVYCD